MTRKPRMISWRTTERLKNVEGSFPYLKRQAAALGIYVEISSTRSGKTQNSWHVILREASTNDRILDWWPGTTYRWWSIVTKERGRLEDIDDVLRVAHGLISKESK